MAKHLLHPSVRRVSVGCGKCREKSEEVVFALGCHSVIHTHPPLICEVLASCHRAGHSREQNRHVLVLWALAV